MQKSIFIDYLMVSIYGSLINTYLKKYPPVWVMQHARVESSDSENVKIRKIHGAVSIEIDIFCRFLRIFVK